MGRTVQIIQRECRDYLGRVVDNWNDFWFTPRDPFAMSVMRILVGWMVFYTVLVWGMRLDSFFNVDGFNSMEMLEKHLLVEEGPFALSFWYWVPDSMVYPVHYLCLAVTFCFMVGLFTRWTSILSLIIVISYAYRARYANYGLDQINAILTLYLCIAPCGAYLSVDRLLRRRRRQKSNPGVDVAPEPVYPTLATNIATRMTQVHFCVIYLAAGLGKLFGETWWDGTAMWRGLANAEYQTLDMTWLAYFPWFTELMTHMTIAWEVSFAFLIWRPLMRPWMLLVGASMHFGIGLMLGMWTFGFCMMFGYLAFLDPLKLRAVLQYVFRTSFGPDDVVVVPPATTRPVPAGAGTLEHVVLLDHSEESAGKTAAELERLGAGARVVSGLDELMGALEDEPDSAVIANLQKVSAEDVERYFCSLQPLALQNRACVTLMRHRQTGWLDSVSMPDHHRILILPCDRKDVINELSKAAAYLSSQESRSRADRAPAVGMASLY